MVGIRAVTFDAYGTLLNIEGMHAKATEEILKVNNFEVDIASFHTLWDKYADQLMSLEPFENIWSIFDRALAKAFEFYGFQDKRIPGDLEIWLNMLKNCSPYPLAKEVVARAGRHFKTALISNADNDELHGSLARYGLQFDVVVSSEDARSYKPRSAIFQQAASALGCKPQEILHLGDSFSADVLGAKAFGAFAVWFNRKRVNIPPGVAEPDYIISELGDLIPLFKKLGQEKVEIA